MGKWNKVYDKVVSGQSDAGIRFDDLCGLLERLGFTERIKGSHHIFGMEGIAESINVQTAKGNAKPYQVGQVRTFIEAHKLTLE